MKIWLIFKVAMAFWINIHGCQPYPRHGHLCTKSAQKPKLLLGTVVGQKQKLTNSKGMELNFVNKHDGMAGPCKVKISYFQTQLLVSIIIGIFLERILI